MLEKIKHNIFSSREFQTLTESTGTLTQGQQLSLRGISGSMLALICAKAIEARQQVLVIASDEDKAEKLRDDCAMLLGEEKTRFFSERPSHEEQLHDVQSSIAQIETMKALNAREKIVVVASPKSIVEKVPSPESFSQTIIELKIHQHYNFQKLIDRLQESGFERKQFVETYGDIAVRGGILDVFPLAGENPHRIEFFGDTVESIREFDVLSQRSIRQLESVSIVPSFSTETETHSGINVSASLFDYLHDDAVIVFDESEIIRKEIDELLNQREQQYFTYDEIVRRCKKFPVIHSSSFQSAIKNPASELVIDFSCISQPSFNGSIHALVKAIQQYSEREYHIYLTCDTKEEAKRLNELIEEELTIPEDEVNSELPTPNVRPSTVHFELLSETLHSGFISHSANIAVFTEHEIFGRLKHRTQKTYRRFKGFSQKELHQLKHGDYVVHVDHGIGTFAGLTKLNVGGIEQEAMKLLFLENDVLYVNLSFVNRVQKYSSQEGHVPKLTRLGTSAWERAKERAKRRIKDIARDLIKLYARRKREKGFAFSPDTHWQKELEASFMYEDTPDQAQSTLDIKRDMEGESPMDRLVCGDVGFGKTEVAVRAAFKAVMNGKQVAVLVPTTILALQHYQTFQDRLSRYSTKVENLTRFKSTKEQKRIVDQLKVGGVDIIIGTHRLLSKDIAVKDLGLLIIDEEHRFGVAAKEKLRQLKASVDTLSLTATPIPRTLHFSLMGARDLSIIGTPPRNRLPIVTEIIPTDRKTHWNVIREAILKELHRGGQVYVVHDRISDIDEIAKQIHIHVHEARAHIAHGQMHGHELEKIMLGFLEKKYNVLVCTKIIESGIDIPSVNTIIINRADRFGMAELYQLRGRVGRSNVQAYAYLLVPPLSVLPKATLRRIQAIEEFTELGSGLNLAMRDLEIRGAGNIFGAEQSGFIMEMGFEMYEKIVREAVDELKKEEFAGTFEHLPAQNQELKIVETVIESDIEAFIPDIYIESDSERLDLYRRIYRMRLSEEVKAIREELHDRFGDYPEEVEHLLQLISLRLQASEAGFQKVALKGETLTVTLPGQSNEIFYGKENDTETPFQHIMTLLSQHYAKNFRLNTKGKELELEFFHLLIGTTQQRLESAARKVTELVSAQRNLA